MRTRRFAAALALALALAPGTLVRTAIPDRTVVDLSITPVADLPDTVSAGGFTREGVWELSSERLDFGGYSALLVLGDSMLRAFSDRGKMLTFAVPGDAEAFEPRFTSVWDRGELSPTPPDIEAATRDPENGDYWLAFENSNSLIRFAYTSSFEAARRPEAWQHWPENGGAEAFEHLPDGRFLVLPERVRTGLLYPSDPTGGAAPLAFTFSLPEGYDPTDLAALPDGRVLVLLRRVEWARPPFASALAIADPRQLEAGDSLTVELLLDLDTLVPRENYEALALARVDADGAVQMWLMSDDNFASFQRTLLVQLSWAGDAEWRKAHEKAREDRVPTR